MKRLEKKAKWKNEKKKRKEKKRGGGWRVAHSSIPYRTTPTKRVDMEGIEGVIPPLHHRSEGQV